MSIGRRPGRALLAMACASLLAPASASAAQHVVDDDKDECPSAGFTSIAAAVAAAQPNDTISVCDGTYYEGTAGAGASALTIDKPLTIKGAGAGRVYVGPAGDLAADAPQLRDAAGNVISVVGTEANLSGMTIFGANRHVEAGVAYVNADGVVSSVEIVDLVRSGQYGGQTGVGFVAAGNEADNLRSVTLKDSLIEGYDAAGIVVDGALGDGTTRPSSSLGVFALVSGNRVMGAGAGAGVAGQDGYRLLNRASTVAVENAFTDNSDAGIDVANSAATSQTRFNANTIQRNRIGFRHVAPFAVCPTDPGRVGAYRLDAVQNWWGSPLGPSTDDVPGRGDAVSGNLAAPAGCTDATGLANTTDRVDFREFLTRPAPVPTPLREFQDLQPGVTITAPAEGTTLVPGEAVSITATASDDIGINSVTFLRGDQVLAVDREAPYTASYTPQGDEAYSAQSITAVATDSRGQTAADSVSVGAGDDAAPTIELLETERLKNGYELYAIADDDRGVEKVTFYLDGEQECVVREAPYSCRVKPRFVPRDRLTIIAIATDTAGQTSTALGTLRLPRKLKPKGLSLRTDTRGRNVYASGRLRLPAGIRNRDGCEGRVEVALRRPGGRVVERERVRLDRSCEYLARLRGERGRTYRIKARFLGNELLRPKSSPTKRVRLR